ncbi:T9SS type A sorting domain-containing protein [Chryseobacterium indologenes]|uniref:T9SS type A sorting domain-containing protein n=1 Tax=Chryseobacterium indologenes TaxID=253 RepID=UPI0021A84D48|nr:T9SS type A sorting domain-containing protein [Elizabethkingia anophelis]
MKTIITSLLLLMYSASYAQWTNNYSVNTLVSNSITNIQSSVGTKDGKTYVVYWDETTGPNNYVLKVQLLDVNGNKMFGNDGMVLNNTVSMGSFVMNDDIATDENNNLYFVFTETGTTEKKAYLHKLSPTGTQLFGQSGLLIGSHCYSPRLKVLNNGSFFIGWTDHLMKYNTDGTKAWINPVIIANPVPGGGDITVGELNLLSDNSIIVIFHVSISGINSNLWAQRYNSSGNAVWSNPVMISNKITLSNARYSSISENDFVYIGYYSPHESIIRFDSYLQKINSDGTLPWGIYGVDFATDDSILEGPTQIVLNGDYIWSAITISDSNQSKFGVAVQKFNKTTGTRLLSNNSKIVFPLTSVSKTLEKNIQIDNGNLVLFFRDGYDTGVDPIKLGITYLNDTGNFIWAQQYQHIAISPNYKTSGFMSRFVNNQCVITWTEDRGQGAKAFAQRFKIENSLNVNDVVSTKFKIFPNPVKDILNIISDKEIKSISIFDMSGKKALHHVEIKNSKVDVSSLPVGGYLVNIELGDSIVKTVKILKVK